MLPYQKEILKDKLPFMLENLVLDATFIAHATSCQLLSEESIEEVQAETTTRKKVLLFIQSLTKQEPKCFNKFCTILKQTHQDHVHKTITYAKQQKVKDLPNSPEVDQNVRSELLMEGIHYRKLSSNTKEKLAEKLVCRKDYDEINAEKQLLREENNKLKEDLQTVRESARYESQHVKIAHSQVQMVTKAKEELEYENTRNMLLIKELRQKIKEFEHKKEQYELKINTLQMEVENLKQLSEEMEGSNQKSFVNPSKRESEEENTNTKSTEHNNSVSDVTNQNWYEQPFQNNTESMAVKAAIFRDCDQSDSQQSFQKHLQALHQSLEKLKEEEVGLSQNLLKLENGSSTIHNQPTKAMRDQLHILEQHFNQIRQFNISMIEEWDNLEKQTDEIESGKAQQNLDNCNNSDQNLAAIGQTKKMKPKAHKPKFNRNNNSHSSVFNQRYEEVMSLNRLLKESLSKQKKEQDQLTNQLQKKDAHIKQMKQQISTLKSFMKNNNRDAKASIKLNHKDFYKQQDLTTQAEKTNYGDNINSHYSTQPTAKVLGLPTICPKQSAVVTPTERNLNITTSYSNISIPQRGINSHISSLRFNTPSAQRNTGIYRNLKQLRQ